MAVATRRKAPAKPGAGMSLAEAMAALEQAGSEQTRKTWRRHGAPDPLFGVSFASLKALAKRIRMDHALALALWDTGNYDARNLAVKVVDPAQATPELLDRWAAEPSARLAGSYVAWLAVESGHGRALVDRWLAAADEPRRLAGWKLVGALAQLDATLDPAWLRARLGELERGIHAAANAEREAMNRTLIAIGCHDAAHRDAAIEAARRIGPVQVDHGDTACKTPDAIDSIARAWAHAGSKGFDSPAAQERGRESLRTRC